MEKIQLDYLELKNFGIFKDVKLDFSDKSVVGILAEYANDKRRSNRSGKTLLMEAIKYLLVGTTRAKKNVNMIHHGKKVMIVKGIFSDSSGKKYTIRRGVDHKNKTVLELDWLQKVRESTEAIEDLFGINKADFELTSFFKQADINGFMDLSPSDKSKYLMRSMNIDHWKNKYDAVMEDIKLYSSRLADNEAVKKALEESLEDIDDLNIAIESTKEELDESIESYNEVKEDIKKERINLNDLKDIKNNARIKYKDYVREQEDISNIGLKISKLQKKVKKLIEENKEYQKDVIELPDRDELVTELANCKNNMAETARTIDKIKTNKNGFCPILKEECDKVEFKKSDIKTLESELLEIKRVIKEGEKSLKRYDKVDNALDDIDYNDREIKRIKKEISETKIEDTRPEIQLKINKLQDILEINSDDIEEKIEKLNDELDDISLDNREFDQKLGGLKVRKKRATEAIKKIDEVAEKNIKLKRIMGDLRFIAGMFSKNGIVANEIENAFQEIEDDCNMLLKELGHNLTLLFSPDKELSKNEPICGCGYVFEKGHRGKECPLCNNLRMKQRKDEISLKIIENGIEKDFSMDSGGGKVIISYVVRIALTMYKRRQNNFRLNMLFLDEVDSALDSHLASGIINSVTRVLVQKLGYSQILMVSHKEEIKNSVPNILRVTRFENHSEASFI